MTTNNEYYDYLVHEVQTVLNCEEEKAMSVVAYVNSLGGDPIEFIHRLPGLLDTTTPDVDELLVMLDNISDEKFAPKYGVCFPAGYQNRAARRKDKKRAAKEAKAEAKRLEDMKLVTKNVQL